MADRCICGVTLKLGGGGELHLTKGAASQSGLLREMLEEGEEEEEQIVPVWGVSHSTMQQVAEWLEHYTKRVWEDIPKPAPFFTLEEMFKEDGFARAYLQGKTRREVFQLQLAAHLLDVASLKQAMNWRVASWIREWPDTASAKEKDAARRKWPRVFEYMDATVARRRKELT